MQKKDPTVNPILNPESKKHSETDFNHFEVLLANRNSGIALETLRHDVTPIGMHYLLSHFDIPYVQDEKQWSLEIGGLVNNPMTLDMDYLKSLPQITQQVTLECAGNGRALLKPHWPSMPWTYEAVGTAEWKGTRLIDVLKTADVKTEAIQWVFSGADEGVDSGVQHDFSRALSIEMANNPDIMLAWEINGQPLPPQHGFPLRLVVPGWYGMASVKWLNRIEAIDYEFQGYQQVGTYVYRKDKDDKGTPVSAIRVKSLMVPPGKPDWYTRKRLLEAGETLLQGRAWSGFGTPITKVEVGIDEDWFEAELFPANEKYAWSRWEFNWQAETGYHQLKCRATDANGDTQPLEPPWDNSGFGNNCVQITEVWVEDDLSNV
ncbi:sulfite oxidase [uncultured Cocleimonas sp.]|uniref:sulfite oxidase n=1 Tax=uncultured Cocleimonas sp. TaxID=1051587 RepID=UPI0026121BBD|nr:sulfite oxidase [uncultured Cocleimonas sp.]